MLTFDSLWKNHPQIYGDAAPCRTNGAKNFSDQCAINLGVALRRSGADLSKLRGVRYCWQHPKAEGHVLAAEEMARALSGTNILGLQRMRKVTPEGFEDELQEVARHHFLREKGTSIFKQVRPLFIGAPQLALLYYV